MQEDLSKAGQDPTLAKLYPDYVSDVDSFRSPLTSLEDFQRICIRLVPTALHLQAVFAADDD